MSTRAVDVIAAELAGAWGPWIDIPFRLDVARFLARYRFQEGEYQLSDLNGQVSLRVKRSLYDRFAPLELHPAPVVVLKTRAQYADEIAGLLFNNPAKRAEFLDKLLRFIGDLPAEPT